MKLVPPKRNERLCRKTNGGTSKAHNMGLANAPGQYVTFMDIDNELDPCMYETLIGMMDETCADIVNRGYWFKVETDILVIFLLAAIAIRIGYGYYHSEVALL